MASSCDVTSVVEGLREHHGQDGETPEHAEGEQDRFAGMIGYVDKMVRQVVEHLETEGLRERTLVLFTGDNGTNRKLVSQMGDVTVPGSKGKPIWYGTHVPFMAQWPARIPAGTRMDAPVHHVDLFHTIAAAAGASVPTDRKLDGVDLVPYVTGERTGAPHEVLFWREGHHQSVQANGWKLIRAEVPDKRWLFNLAEDPTERVNLAAREPARVAELEALLARHNAEQAEPLWPSVLNAPQLIDKHGGQAYEDGDEYIYWPN